MRMDSVFTKYQRLAYKPQTCVSHTSGGLESVPDQGACTVGSSEGPVPGCRLQTWLWPHLEDRGLTELLGSLF